MSDLLTALRSCYSALMAAHETMEGIFNGTQRLEQPEWDVIKPIHEDSLKLGAAALDEMDRIKFGAEEPLKIKRWLWLGQFGDQGLDHPADTNELYESAGNLLDRSCSSEILGQLLFEGENGKFYTMSVEAALSEAHPAEVEDALKADGQN